MLVFEGKDGVQSYRAVAIKVGLKLYAKTGIKPNRAWSPMAMLQAAGRITGKQYKRGQYLQAVADLDAWVTAHGTTG